VEGGVISKVKALEAINSVLELARENDEIGRRPSRSSAQLMEAIAQTFALKGVDEVISPPARTRRSQVAKLGMQSGSVTQGFEKLFKPGVANRTERCLVDPRVNANNDLVGRIIATRARRIAGNARLRSPVPSRISPTVPDFIRMRSSSRREDSHLRALPDPYVNLSIHTDWRRAESTQRADVPFPTLSSLGA
jgi:hypothetical protein